MTKQELENLKADLRARGIKEGSAKWLKLINEAFTTKGRGYSSNETRDRTYMPTVSENNVDYNLQGLLGMLEDYITNGQINNENADRIDEATAENILKYLINKGYDIGFRDTSGNIRSLDKRLGNKTIMALNLELSILNGADGNEYELDSFYVDGNELPMYNRIPGYSPEQIKKLTNMYYSYFKLDPKMFGGLLKDQIAAQKILPFLPDQALSLLSRLSFERYIDENGRGLDLPELAYRNMLGSRGTQLMLAWELENVTNASNRGAQNLKQTFGGDILGAGLKLMGRITGGSSGEMGGLTYSWTYNPVTRQMQKVAVPNPTATVYSNITQPIFALDEYGRTITLANGQLAESTPTLVEGAVVNTLTDPLTWAVGAARGDWDPAVTKKYVYNTTPGSSYPGVIIDGYEGMPLEGGIGEAGVLTSTPITRVIPKQYSYTLSNPEITPATVSPGKPKYSVIGNRRNGFRGKHGGVNNVVATSTPTEIYNPAIRLLGFDIEEVSPKTVVTDNIYDYHRVPYTVTTGLYEVTPVSYTRPGIIDVASKTTPGAYYYQPSIIPAFRGNANTLPKPNTVYDTPYGQVIFTYEKTGIGYNMNILDLDGNLLQSIPISKWQGARWRDLQPLSGFLPSYRFGIFDK